MLSVIEKTRSLEEVEALASDAADADATFADLCEAMATDAHGSKTAFRGALR
jgi:hypothetical protein